MQPCALLASGAASIGVIRVNSMDDLHKAYHRVVRDLSRAKVVAGALVEGTDDEEDKSGNAGTWIKVQLMLEEVGPACHVNPCHMSCYMRSRLFAVMLCLGNCVKEVVCRQLHASIALLRMRVLEETETLHPCMHVQWLRVSSHV